MRDQQSSIFFSVGHKGTWEPASGLCRIVFEETGYHKKKRKRSIRTIIHSLLHYKIHCSEKVRVHLES